MCRTRLRAGSLGLETGFLVTETGRRAKDSNALDGIGPAVALAVARKGGEDGGPYGPQRPQPRVIPRVPNALRVWAQNRLAIKRLPLGLALEHRPDKRGAFSPQAESAAGCRTPAHLWRYRHTPGLKRLAERAFLGSIGQSEDTEPTPRTIKTASPCLYWPFRL